MLAKLGSREEAIDALARYDAAVTADTDPRPLFARLRGFAERYAILANIVLARNARRAEERCAARAPAAADLKAFDSLLGALVNRVPEQFDGALREMRLAGIAGVARLAEIVAGGQFDRADASQEIEALTPAERAVLRGMSQGLGNQAIADDQQRTINTVRTHVSSILRKLGCTTRGEAVATARRQGLV